MRLPHLALAAVLALVILSAARTEAEEHGRANPDETMKALLEGNARYTSSQPSSCTKADATVRETLAKGQKPPAIVLSCSDSRVPPELIFDQTLGDLFVVRVAGNVPDPIVLGSIEYAAEHLGSSLIVVLGHERCGAVTAAVDAKGKPTGNIGAIVSAIAPAVAQAKKEAAGKERTDLVDMAITDNVKLVAASLTKRSPVLAKLVKEGAVKIVTARYDLDDGKVAVLDASAATGAPAPAK